MALNEALDRLAKLDSQQSRIVELRYFGGLTVEDTSEFLGISPATVKRSWSSARLWLQSGNEPRRGTHMTPEQWQRVRPILECALELEPESRPAYVDCACAGDEELRVEILSLLSEPKQSDSFLREPALNMVRRHMAQDQAQLDKAEEFALVGKRSRTTAFSTNSVAGEWAWSMKRRTPGLADMWP